MESLWWANQLLSAGGLRPVLLNTHLATACGRLLKMLRLPLTIAFDSKLLPQRQLRKAPAKLLYDHLLVNKRHVYCQVSDRSSQLLKSKCSWTGRGNLACVLQSPVAADVSRLQSRTLHSWPSFGLHSAACPLRTETNQLCSSSTDLAYKFQSCGTNLSILPTSQAPFTTSCVSMATEPKIKAKVRGIQKDVSPLTTKRIVRRKKSREATGQDKEVFDATAFATAEELNLEAMLADLQRQGLYQQCPLPADVPDALHVEARYRVDDEPREIFFFREGSVIFWNMPEVERSAVKMFMRRHQTDSYDELLIQSEYENVEFTFTDTNTCLVGDEIQLQKQQEGTEVHQQLEKYTFSNALALSVKLAVWEASLERYVESIEWVLQDLKDGKKVRISRDDMLRKTGELFTLRHLINLSSDLLDTPDFYWDRERLERLYVKTCSHLNIARRTKVMNEKLTHCNELAELVTSHLNDKHHVRLEWMIILLIMVEVAFEILHVIERHTAEDHGALQETDTR